MTRLERGMASVSDGANRRCCGSGLVRRQVHGSPVRWPWGTRPNFPITPLLRRYRTERLHKPGQFSHATRPDPRSLRLKVRRQNGVSVKQLASTYLTAPLGVRIKVSVSDDDDSGPDLEADFNNTDQSTAMLEVGGPRRYINDLAGKCQLAIQVGFK